jgi:transposase-like protein
VADCQRRGQRREPRCPLACGVIALYARGMTTRDIRAHMRKIYDVDASPT